MKLDSYLTVRIWIGLGLLAMGVFLYGFITEVGVGNPWLFYVITISLAFKLLRILFEWYHIAGIKPTSKPVSTREWQVDILTTSCPEEPREMIEETVRAMVAIQYPHQNYLCDEGNDPYLQQLCQSLGVHYVTRETRTNAKAGNINNALRGATGEICVILDPDHVPTPDFLDEVLPYFEDSEVGYVQVVQAYKNQQDSLIARAAAEQTYNFYGPFMRGMSSYNTAQAIGANCTFRRSALDSIGGHAPGLTEDMHTSMLLHAKKWKSVYEPKVISNGLVPSSLSAYYKQQLKWSRGTFDLWFHVYTKLFFKFNWRQKLHYGILPLYYLLGVISLIDIVVPVVALVTQSYPWKMKPLDFFAYFLPLLGIYIAIRLVAQQWLNKPKERGLHLLGGVMRIGTWWVFITGFIYTIFNVRVPYIPTPKVHNPKNEFLLGLPNLIVALGCFVAVGYGLYWDWHPYSFLMAFFALVNGLFLLMSFIMGQNALLSSIYRFWYALKYRFSFVGVKLSYLRVNLFAIKGLYFAPLVILAAILHFAFQNNQESMILSEMGTEESEKVGNFFSGIYTPTGNDESDLETFINIRKQTDHPFSVFSTYLAWGPAPLPENYWQKIIGAGTVPMITWEPWTNLFTEYQHVPDLAENKKVFHYILEGYFDDYIDRMAVSLRDLKNPVFLRFAHEMDNPMYPWSALGGNTAEEFIAAWKYVHDRFEDLGAENVTWVWNPWKPEAIEKYFPNGEIYPESRYVDWVGLTSLNYGKANPDQQWYSFKQLYQPFRNQFTKLNIELPVMLAEFGTVSYGGNGNTWIKEALTEMENHCPEIKSVIFFNSQKDKNWVSDWRPENNDGFIHWSYDFSQFKSELNELDVFMMKPDHGPTPLATVNPSSKNYLSHQGSSFQLLDRKVPFYIKGVCYNPQHDWRDGFLPLSRKQLEKDFQLIKEMGANTIRRYEPGIYDRNILQIAEEKGLKVMYGFWFDPAIDYYTDHEALEKYEKKVLDYVVEYKDEPGIIAWNIGNETWGLQKKYYVKPYLTLTRRAYVGFLNELAMKIHEIDPTRMVLSSEEHEHYQLPATLRTFRDEAPALDAIGINSYYQENISKLDSVWGAVDPTRPYIVTEFGPKGYWSYQYSDIQQDKLVEVSSVAKAVWYEEQWNDLIAKDQGHNLGGFAFSWRDRYEGTSTWFGITDYQGRLKPAYFYLQEAYTGQKIEKNQFADLSIVGSWYPAKPGETVWLSAGIANNFHAPLRYQWKVLNVNEWKEVTKIENTIMDNQYVEIQIPEEKANYRVYVYAEDTLGHVVTASKPVLLD